MVGFLPWLNHLAYAACLYLVARLCIGPVRRVADALALNWLAGLLVWASTGGALVLPAYILIDFLTAAYLLGSVNTRTARWVGLMHIPAILANGSLYIGSDVLGLAGLSLNTWSWLQMALLIAVAWNDGLGEVVDRVADRLRRGRAALAGLSTKEGSPAQ